jgi:glucokinase
MNTRNCVSLVADIGGTNARFALQHPDGTTTDALVLQCADYPHINDAIASYLGRVSPKEAPKAAGLAVAGPPNDVYVKLTNAHWEFYVRDIKDRFGFFDVKIINDFTAIALAIPALEAADVQQIGGEEARPGAAYTVLGPGTGLGVSTVVPAKDPKFIILTNTEGGHFTIPPMTDRESEVLAVLRRHFNHVSAERVLSGAGIVSIYKSLCEIDGIKHEDYAPADITARGLDNTCPICHETLDMFCAFLGTAASNLCITVAAYGGVYLAGGILGKLGTFFEESKFRKRFETKGRFSNYLEPVPAYLIKHPLPAMLGLRTLMLEL